jgi:hypothetical protein
MVSYTLAVIAARAQSNSARLALRVEPSGYMAYKVV